MKFLQKNWKAALTAAVALAVIICVPHSVFAALGGVSMGMAFFSPTVETTLVNDLERAYENMAFGSNYAAIVGLFKKEEKNGDAVKVPLVTDFGAGQSATASVAYANASLAGRQAFIVTPFKCYGESLVPLDQAVFANGDDNSVVDLLLDESQKAMDSANMQLDQALGASGYGEVATISTHSGSGPSYTLVLSSRSDVNHITLNANYVSKATPATGSLDVGATAFFTVTNINQSTNTIVVTASNSWAPTDGHVIGLQGSMIASTSPSQWPGIPGWIPPAANRPVSLSDSFYTVNRSVNEGKLAGLYLDISAAGTPMGILEGINQLSYSIADIPGANPDMCVMAFATLGKINAVLQTQNRYMTQDIKGPDIDVFFKTVTISGPRGDMALVGSSNWSSSTVAVLDKSTWVLGAPGNKHLRPATATDNPVETVPGQDTAVVAYRCAAFVYCTAPGKNGMLTIPASS